MNRREAVQHISILLGGTLVGANAFLAGCKSNDAKSDVAFAEDDIAYLDEIAETILPATKTPGAKAAKVGQFMTVMVNDCYTENDQKAFHEGMKKLNDASKDKFDKKFMNLTPAQRHELLVAVDKEAKEYQQKKKEYDAGEDKKEGEELVKGNKDYKKKTMTPHYFRMMKELTLLGFFTSEVGATQALRYKETPGKYEACIPYKKGDRAWA
jgi:hypothetical protein